MLVFYLAFIMGLLFYNNDVEGAQHYQAISLRSTLLSMAQLPLIILLAGKNNFIGLVTGVSYERLNVLHRWVARGLFLTATIHGFAQIYGWSRFGLVTIESQTDACWPRGTSALFHLANTILNRVCCLVDPSMDQRQHDCSYSKFELRDFRYSTLDYVLGLHCRCGNPYSDLLFQV